MNTTADIASFGFHPGIVQNALSRAVGDSEVQAMVCQMEADLDNGGVFRHFTVIALAEGLLVHVHVDEDEGGRVSVVSSAIPAASILSVHVRRLVAPVEGGDAAGTARTDEITVEVNHQENRRTDVEPVRCTDPNCAADHGYSAISSPEDLMLRVSATADGREAVEQAEVFARELSRMVAARAADRRSR